MKNEPYVDFKEIEVRILAELLDKSKYAHAIDCKHDAQDGCPQSGSVYWYRSFLEIYGEYRLVLAGSKELTEFPLRGEFYLALPKGYDWKKHHIHIPWYAKYIPWKRVNTCQG